MFLEDVRDSFRTISCGIPIPHEIVLKESISTRLVWCHGTCPPLSSPPHANSFVIGPAVIKHKHTHGGYKYVYKKCMCVRCSLELIAKAMTPQGLIPQGVVAALGMNGHGIENHWQ